MKPKHIIRGVLSMIGICTREFKSLFKSIRSFIIIGIIFGATFGISKLVSLFQGHLQEHGFGDDVYASGLLLLVLLLGPLFVFALSHDSINKETSSRTIRFIATKTSRDNIIIGKFLGTLLFWTICLTITLFLVAIFSKTFYFLTLIQALIYIAYFISLALLLSVLIPRPAITTFLGTTLSMAFTALGVWSIGSDKVWLKIYSYITPYYYYGNESMQYTYFVSIFPLVILAISLILMRKKDL